MNRLLITIVVILIIQFFMWYFYYLQVKPKYKIEKSKWGNLLYSKFPYIRIYENGIKPSRFGYLLFEFIPYENIIGIYKLYSSVNKFLGYTIHYDNGSKRNLKKIGLEGTIFVIKPSQVEFNKVLNIIRKQIGKKIDDLYIPDRILTFELTFSSRQFKIKYL